MGEVLRRLGLGRPELLAGAFLRMRLSRTRLFLPGPPEEAWEWGLPVLEATDWDLELGESTELPFPLKECSLFEISLIFAFFLD